MPTEAEFKKQLQNGLMVESPEEATEGYADALTQTLLISADTEMMSAPAYYSQAMNAPGLNARASTVSVVQDELGHAHMDYRLLEEFGYDREELIFGREAHEFRNPYGFDQPLENFAELATAHGLFDRAGMVLLGDVHHNTSYGPWKRALRKIDKEEKFHLRHGETWMKRFARKNEKTLSRVQDAVDWMFPMAIEWFGLPDDKKQKTEQLDYCIKGKTNDELRDEWTEWTIEAFDDTNIEIPAHIDNGEVVVEYDYPVAFVEEDKEWRFDEPISWDDAFGRWRDRGQANKKHVEMIQDKL